MEGAKELLQLTYYPELPDGPLENDDLDLQLVWLHALEQYGPFLTARELGQEWLDHVFFPYDEYGYALANLRRGLLPPVSGAFNNPFADCMGSPIRSEIWAMVAPGLPDVAAGAATAALAAGVALAWRRREGAAFTATAAAIACTTAALFGVLWHSPLPGLTVAEAASGPYTLTVMTWIAAVALPFVLAYQGWTYWVFRKRLTRAAVSPSPHGKRPATPRRVAGGTR